MSFGGDLWDQYPNVELYSQTGIQFLEKLNEFLKKRAEIERDYAKSLQKLVRGYKEEIAKKNTEKNAGSFQKALQSGKKALALMMRMSEYDLLERPTAVRILADAYFL
ncbi:hypothetical protein BDK51DRAFT_51520 [Blyttiomyces helicus]|uniref:FCH domain-containing protein n=1 Tax=Blyttiomyces helicus TaxID=388810 RepID=A0A4V1ISE7_9FUNG|nr:hypothetical protein BDK51DRAFT_51520 [Blyttiomyces helicus]|eukprot:RKO93297.1 hypothetical protein BDK51DRAFT_51520 [Blyttiomyces helicus]